MSDLFTENLWQTKESCSQKVFLTNREIRNLLGSWSTKAFCADSREMIGAVLLQFEKFCADFHDNRPF
jgi:hypothetical protein